MVTHPENSPDGGTGEAGFSAVPKTLRVSKTLMVWEPVVWEPGSKKKNISLPVGAGIH